MNSFYKPDPPYEDIGEDFEDHLMWLDNCGVWYDMTTEDAYDESFELIGNFKEAFGDDARGLDPEAFGIMDENEFEDIQDLMFRFIRHTREYTDSSCSTEPQCLAALSEAILEEESLTSDVIKLNIEYNESKDFLFIRGYHPNIGPVWSETNATISFPTDYVVFSNAVLDIYHHCETVQALSHGCAHCWASFNVNPVEEIAEEYSCEFELVEDLLYASREKEIKGYGPIQPDCPVCYGTGVDSMGGWDTL